MVTDGGPSFRGSFKSYLKAFDINHHYSSAYRPSSNGLAECGVRSIKEVLDKVKVLTEKKLKEIIFEINCHSQGEEGSKNV